MRIAKRTRCARRQEQQRTVGMTVRSARRVSWVHRLVRHTTECITTIVCVRVCVCVNHKRDGRATTPEAAARGAHLRMQLLRGAVWCCYVRRAHTRSAKHAMPDHCGGLRIGCARGGRAQVVCAHT